MDLTNTENIIICTNQKNRLVLARIYKDFQKSPGVPLGALIYESEMGFELLIANKASSTPTFI